MKNAFLKTSNNSAPSNKPSLRFEIHSLPSTHPSSSSQQKWYIKANHPTEASRWITAIRACMDWYTKRDRITGCDATPNLTVAGVGGAEVEMMRRASGESYSDSKSVYSFVKSTRPQFLGRTSMAPTGLSISVSGIGTGDADSINVASAVDPVDFGIFSAEKGEEEDEDEDMETSSTDTGARGLSQVPPFEAECEIAANSVVMQLEAVQQLVVGCLGSTTTASGIRPHTTPAPEHLLQPLAMEPSVSSSRSIQSSSGVSVSSSKASSHKAQPHLHPPVTAVPLPLSVSPLPTSTVSSTTSHLHESLVLTSFDQLSSLLDKHLHIVSAREEWYKKKLKSERRRQSVWEESLKTVVREGEMLENELKERRRRGSVRVGELDLGGGRKRTETIKATQGVGSSVVSQQQQQQQAKVMELSQQPLPPARIGLGTMGEEGEEYDDSEDEFFDAIESNNLPGLVIPPPLNALSSPVRLPSSSISEEPYSGT